jgi:FtsH-binding integral membrane protein
MATAVLPQRTEESIGRSRRIENVFFSGMALLILTTVFIGFARSYFLAGVFRAPLPGAIIHIHGAAFSCWILLLIAQVSLVTAGRVDIHRKLGLAGFGLACLMVILGVLAATNSLSRGFAPPGSGMDPKTFFVIPLADMLVFATLVFFAYRARFNPSAHKRLILIATITLMDAPTGRPPFNVITAHPFLDGAFTWVFLLLLVGYDLWSTRRVQRATIWAGLFLLIVQQLRFPIGNSGAWHALAAWVQTLAQTSH